MGLDPSLRHNLTFVMYPAGHQIYTDPASLKKLRADVAAFVSSPKTR
jgi:carboxypeptidase C (cathepsin A)